MVCLCGRKGTDVVSSTISELVDDQNSPQIEMPLVGSSEEPGYGDRGEQGMEALTHPIKSVIIIRSP